MAFQEPAAAIVREGQVVMNEWSGVLLSLGRSQPKFSLMDCRPEILATPLKTSTTMSSMAVALFGMYGILFDAD